MLHVQLITHKNLGQRELCTFEMEQLYLMYFACFINQMILFYCDRFQFLWQFSDFSNFQFCDNSVKLLARLKKRYTFIYIIALSTALERNKPWPSLFQLW